MQQDGAHKKKRETFLLLSFSDLGGIQTHNLLIRSQMLYSVELRSHPCIFVGDDGFEPPTLCL